MSNECKCKIPNTDLAGRCFKCGGSNNQLPADVQERIKTDAERLSGYNENRGDGALVNKGRYYGYIAGATAVHERAQTEIERRNKLLEDDLKLQCRLNKPDISEHEQETAWQAFKTKHNL